MGGAEPRRKVVTHCFGLFRNSQVTLGVEAVSFGGHAGGRQKVSNRRSTVSEHRAVDQGLLLRGTDGGSSAEERVPGPVLSRAPVISVYRTVAVVILLGRRFPPFSATTKMTCPLPA